MAEGWAAERRLDYIDFRLTTAGHIRRADIVRTFGVSVPQASQDLNRFLALYPDAMAYDKSAKRYEARRSYRTLRGNGKGVIGHIKALRRLKHPMGWS